MTKLRADTATVDRNLHADQFWSGAKCSRPLKSALSLSQKKSMAINNYYLEKSNVDIDASIVEPNNYLKIVEAVFASWKSSAGGVAGNPTAPVAAKVILRTEGLSSAEVSELFFTHRINKETIASFVVRVHTGANARESANAETSIVRQINAVGNDSFSSTILVSDDLPANVVVYRHAADEVGRPLDILSKAIGDALSSRNEEQIDMLCRLIPELANAVTTVYRKINDEEDIQSGRLFFERIRHGLPPDLMIDLRRSSCHIINNNVLSVEHDDTFKDDISKCEHLTGQQLFDSISLLGGNKKWISVDLELAPHPWGRGYIRLECDSVRIGLRVDEGTQNQLVANNLSGITIVTYLKDGHISAVADLWERMKLTKAAWVANEDRRYPFDTIPTVRCMEQHDDLHGGNILYDRNRFKIIDLGSLSLQPVGCTQARLEVSLWEHITLKIPIITEADANYCLDTTVENGDKLKQLSWTAWALRKLMHSIRQVPADVNGSKLITDDELLVAYSHQILTFERYWLEREAQIPPALSLYARHLLENLTAFAKVAVPSSKQATGVLEQCVGKDHSSSSIETTTEPTIATLWRTAIHTPGYESVIEANAQDLIDALVAEHSQYMNYALTDLQRSILMRADDVPFQSDSHVIISAPTSSGKSTIAEMFLVGPWLWGSERTCALYIAPTRALAQAKYRDLKSRFRGVPKLCNRIVLSTGEDTDHDRQIGHGRFAIACMVYEKANILFSRNRRLLSALGCVVVDEMHLLTNLDRGPVLETTLTKVLRERRRIESAEARMRRDSIRVIAISTEDRPDVSVETFLSIQEANGSLRPPLIFFQPQRPISVTHYLVLPTNGDQLYQNFPVTLVSAKIVSLLQIREHRLAVVFKIATKYSICVILGPFRAPHEVA